MDDHLLEDQAKAGDRVILGLLLVFGSPLWVLAANFIWEKLQ